MMEKPQNETDILSADEQKLREMCCSLNKIEAPKDFDFKLKARIANSKANDFQPRFGFAFRYGLPALALILVFGILAHTGGFLSSNGNQVVAGGSSKTPNAVLPQNSTGSNFTAPERKEQPAESTAVLSSNQSLPKVIESEVADAKPRFREINKKREVKNISFNGSELKSVTPPVVVQPRGFEQRTPLPNPQNNEKTTPMKVKEILSQIGVNADFENGKWTVKSVAANSVGETSGVRENDVIEAIDEKPLSTETINSKTVSGKTLTVTRGGEKSQITLRSKQ